MREYSSQLDGVRAYSLDRQSEVESHCPPLPASALRSMGSRFNCACARSQTLTKWCQACYRFATASRLHTTPPHSANLQARRTPQQPKPLGRSCFCCSDVTSRASRTSDQTVRVMLGKPLLYPSMRRDHEAGTVSPFDSAQCSWTPIDTVNTSSRECDPSTTLLGPAERVS